MAEEKDQEKKEVKVKETKKKEAKVEETKEKDAKKWSSDIKKLGDKIVGLTLLQAKELGDYLKEEHGIEPAAGGAVMVAVPAAGGGEEAEEKTSFDVVLDGAPKAVKEGISKDDAEAIVKQLEAVGAVVELA